MLRTLNRLLLCVMALASINSLAFAKGSSDVQCRPVREDWSLVKLREFNLKTQETTSKTTKSSFSSHHLQITSYFPLYQIAWSPDSSRIAVGERDIYVWDVTNNAFLTTLEPIPSEFPRENHRIEGSFGVGLAWSPDGKRIAAIYNDATIRIWDAENDWATLVISLENLALPSLVWSPDSTQIAAQGQIWDAQTGELVQANSGRIFADINALYSGNRVDEEYELRNLSTNEITTIPTDASIVDVVLTEDGGRLMSSDRQISPRVIQICQIWDLNTQREIMRTEDKGFGLPDTRLSPTGQTFVVVRYDNVEFSDETELWNVETGELLATLNVGNFEWSSDGTCFAAAHYDLENGETTIVVQDVVTSENMEFDVPAIVLNLAWSPDGTMLATTSDDGTLRIWGAAGD